MCLSTGILNIIPCFHIIFLPRQRFHKAITESLSWQGPSVQNGLGSPLEDMFLCCSYTNKHYVRTTGMHYASWVHNLAMSKGRAFRLVSEYPTWQKKVDLVKPISKYGSCWLKFNRRGALFSDFLCFYHTSVRIACSVVTHLTMARFVHL